MGAFIVNSLASDVIITYDAAQIPLNLTLYIAATIKWYDTVWTVIAYYS